MKVKDWIKELEKLNPEDELYVDNNGLNYQLLTPVVQKRNLAKRVIYKRTFIHEDNGFRNEIPIGDCSTIKLNDW